MAKQPSLPRGSANVDLTTFNDGFRGRARRSSARTSTGFGGKGANQAVAARLCGANVGMVMKVGSDSSAPPPLRISNPGITSTSESPRAHPAASLLFSWNPAGRIASSSKG
jgi:hypothetical protein